MREIPSLLVMANLVSTVIGYLELGALFNFFG